MRKKISPEALRHRAWRRKVSILALTVFMAAGSQQASAQSLATSLLGVYASIASQLAAMNAAGAAGSNTSTSQSTTTTAPPPPVRSTLTQDKSLQEDGAVALQGNNEATLTNEAQIAIQGNDGKAMSADADATLANSGHIAITGNAGVGIEAALRGSIVNEGEIVIEGSAGAGIDAGEQSQVRNAGRIAIMGANSVGIAADAGSTVENAEEAVIETDGEGNDSVVLNTGSKLTNNGIISARGQQSIAVHAYAGAEVVNRTLLHSSQHTALVGGDNLKLENSGEIASDSGDAVQVAGAATDITNKGLVRAQRHGMVIDGEAAQLANSGYILAQGGNGVDYNGKGGTLTNSGTIGAGGDGIAVHDSGNKVVNDGEIKAQKVGVHFTAGGNMLDVAGTVEGNEKAVRFTGTGNRLVVRSGAKLRGGIDLGEETTVEMAFRGNAVLQVDDVGKARVAGTGLVAKDTSGNRIIAVDTTAMDQDVAHTAVHGGAVAAAVRGGMASNGGAMRVTAASGEGPALSQRLGAALGLGVLMEGFYRRSTDVIDNTWDVESRTHGGLFGLHHEVMPGLRVGLLAGASNGSSEQKLRGSGLSLRNEIDTRSYFGGIYGRQDIDNFFITGLIMGGTTRYKGSRQIYDITTGTVEVAQSSYRGRFATAELGVGASFDTGLLGLQATPQMLARLDYTRTDAYTESGAAGAVSVGEKRRLDLTGQLQFRLHRDYQLAEGTLRAHARFGAVLSRRSSDDFTLAVAGRQTSATSVGDGNRYSHLFGGGLMMNFDTGMTLYGDAEYLMSGDDADDLLLRAGLKMSF